MADKQYLSANGLLDDSFALGRMVLESKFNPTFIVGIWRGGSPIAIAVHELFSYVGIETKHCAIQTSSYDGMEQKRAVTVTGMDYLVEHITPADRLLIVDDVFDTGLSLKAVLADITARCVGNHPAEIKTATVYYKPLKNETNIAPDYYCHETDKWLVFPHELKGCSVEEIARHKGLHIPKG